MCGECASVSTRWQCAHINALQSFNGPVCVLQLCAQLWNSIHQVFPFTTQALRLHTQQQRIRSMKVVSCYECKSYAQEKFILISFCPWFPHSFEVSLTAMCRCSPRRLLACLVPVCVCRRLQNKKKEELCERLNMWQWQTLLKSFIHLALQCYL